MKDPFADTGIFFTGSVIQKVVNEKVAEEVIEFKDLPKGHWSEKAINHLAKEKLFVGYGNGKFGFGDNITRGQVAVLI
ncbi:S-layer homology domain-containing protein, partial [Klebsiella pneumoniae]|uniref:S-layer homology domain-containing protein n=1 Tax=Klebsiella pneumoniae TaxID=573 RepID=UPI00196813ED